MTALTSPRPQLEPSERRIKWSMDNAGNWCRAEVDRSTTGDTIIAFLADPDFKLNERDMTHVRS